MQVAAADVREACRWQLWMSSVQMAAADEQQRAGGSCGWAVACRRQLQMSSSVQEAAVDEQQRAGGSCG